MPQINYLSVKKDVPATGYWDHTYLNDVLADIVSEGDREVVVIPGAYQWDVVDQINVELAKWDKILVIITSDEEGKFDIQKLKHPDMIVYTQYGNGGRMFPLGYAPGTRETLKELGPLEKNVDWFFAGQITHYRRKLLDEQLRKLHKTGDQLVATDGFAKGIPQKLYLQALTKAKAAPCAPGPMSVDSFRMYEALEAGCVPIADDTSPLRSYPDQYWYRLFGNVPFPVFNDYTKLPVFIEYVAKSEDINNQVFAWWINRKHQFKSRLKEHLGVPDYDMAVVVPVSPIPSHPDTSILEETISTIRVHTNAPILLTFDGVREEQEDQKANYREFIRKILWKCNFEYENVLPIIFDEHVHQSGMMKVVLANISVPYLLYVEQDCPLTPDWSIPLDELKKRIASGESNLIRFHFESFIPEPHEHLMIGEPSNNLQKTIQWSQRPHLASTDYYRSIMASFFTDESKTFIEDRMHGIIQTNPWEEHKLHIYHPVGSIKRSYHLDGRAGAEKYDDRLIY